MNEEAVLARLLAQASARGGSGDPAAMQAVIEEASELGARRALARLGDAAARDDIVALRELLRAWRDAKRSAWKAAIDWCVRGALALLILGIAYRTGLGGLLK